MSIVNYFTGLDVGVEINHNFSVDMLIIVVRSRLRGTEELVQHRGCVAVKIIVGVVVENVI